MHAVVLEGGKVVVRDVAVPSPGPNEVLVKVYRSAVSTGTELHSIQTRKNVYIEALKDPRLRERFFNLVKRWGLLKAYRVAKSKVSLPVPLGYSNAGVVVSVGENVTEFKPGDRVACAGGGYAVHASYVTVPKNLVVKIPDGVSFDDAAFVAIGSIALQGVRRANPTLGERFVVIGLGLIGVLTAQILKADGVEVLGADIDPRKIERARKLGIHAVHSKDLEKEVRFLTDGVGADGVIITAAAKTSAIVNQALEIVRKKGRVVIVGDVGLSFKREEWYKKEVDVLMSTSYGPGRYDPLYEEQGIDYPLPYVRWTENRNMRAFLELLAKGSVKIPLDGVFPVEEAPNVYERLAKGELNVVAFSYAEEEPKRVVVIRPNAKPVTGSIRVGLIGPGSFATSVHLPNLSKSPDYEIVAIAGKNGASTETVAKKFGARYYTTDYRELLKDENIDAVFITTRHNLHTPMLLEALKAGKHVFVEKPIAISLSELENVRKALKRSSTVVMVGHNRRYSPYVRKVKEVITHAPRMVAYRVNAGFLPSEHWVHGPEGGTRIVGEGVHFFDVLLYLFDSAPSKISASYIGPAGGYRSDDNVLVSMEFESGDVGSVLYTALGSSSVEKEYMEAFGEGKVVQMWDYMRLDVNGRTVLKGAQDKGYIDEINLFARAIRGEDYSWRRHLQDALLATEIAIKVRDKLV